MFLGFFKPAPLLYVLQVYGNEIERAHKLAHLHQRICSKVGKKYTPDVVAVLAYRRDCPRNDKLEKSLAESFEAVSIFRSSRRETGFPGGSNGLWCGFMSEFASLPASLRMQVLCALTTEVDAFPLTVDWPERLLSEWVSVNRIRKVCVMGHWLSIGDFSCGHINGNALFDPHIVSRDASFIGCSTNRAWDTQFAPHFKRHGWKPTSLIQSWYREVKVSDSRLRRAIERRCVWLHGIKDDSVIRFLESELSA